MKRRMQLSSILLGLSLVFAHAGPVTAQRSSAAAEPEDVTLLTKDGVELRATYYPSAGGEKQAIVPVVLLHDYKETRAVFNDLARALQASGDVDGSERSPRAVLTVDFRGHGESKTARGLRGETFELDAANFRQSDYEAMVEFDMEAVRKFLVAKNNAGQLNLNQLCVVGSGMGANVALLWAANDWSVPQLPRVKQGEDVRALVLVSPKWSYRGLPLVRAVKHPAIQQELSMFLAYGEEDEKASKDAANIYKNLEKFRPDPPRDRLAEQKDLYRIRVPTLLQGTELLTKPQFHVAPKVDEFIERRLGRKSFPWFDRSLN